MLPSDAAMNFLHVHQDNDQGAVASYGPVVFVVWRQHVVANFDVIDQAIDELVAREGAGRRLFYVHRAPAGALQVRNDPSVLARATVHFDRHDPHFAASAVAIESTGFGATIVRSVSAGVMLARRSPVRTELFKDVRMGIRWLADCGRTINAFDADDLIAGLDAHALITPTVAC